MSKKLFKFWIFNYTNDALKNQSLSKIIYAKHASHERS